MLRLSRLLALALLCLLATAPVFASITIGGITFDDNAFVDSLTSSSGSWTVSGAATLEDSLIGSDTNSYAFCFGGPSACSLNLAFTDNTAVNGAGADIAVFELGVPDNFEMKVNGITNTYSTADTGFTAAGFQLNVGLVDLSDFGIGAGDSVSSIELFSIDDNDTGTTISFDTIGAINSSGTVPEPGSIALFGTGLAGLAGIVRRKLAK